jgi:hypothetical protein
MKKVILFEPQCKGLEHLIFNSSILAMVSRIFAGNSVKIYGEEKHISLLQERVAISAVKVKLPKGCFLGIKKVLFEFNSLLKIKKEKPGLLFLLSVTPFTIIISNILFRNTVFFFFFHGILETLYNKYYFYNYNYWLKPAFAFQGKNNINIVLGENIKQELEKFLPGVKNIYTLDHPYPRYSKGVLSNYFPMKVKIGTIGFGWIEKGSHLIFELEKKLQYINLNTIELHYIGQILDPDIKIPDDTLVKIHGNDKPLEENDFNILVDEMYYCIFFYPVSSYKLTASGAVFDALTHLKPVIAIRNAYFEYIFNKMGNIGYLCDSLEEILVCIQYLDRFKNINIYREQQKNIINGLKYFSIEYLETKLKDIVDTYTH